MLLRNLLPSVCLVAFGASARAPMVLDKVPLPDVVELHIESLTRQELLVRVTSAPPGLWPDSAGVPEAREQVVLRTPAVVKVADSVLTVRVTVIGSGAFRVLFGDGASSDEQGLAPRGRDITLGRGSDGRFRPVWQVHPLIP